MSKRKLEVIKKFTIFKCYKCSGTGTADKVECNVCKGTGKYKESTYYHIYKDKDGKKYCIEGDTLK